MKKLLLLSACFAFATHIQAQNNVDIWQVEDSTYHVKAITGLTPTQGFEKNQVSPGYGDTYTYSWINDVIQINFTNTQYPSQWSDMGFYLSKFVGGTGNYFMYDSQGNVQQHDNVQGFSVDFSNPLNRTVTFKIQTSDIITINPFLTDIAGKNSNGDAPRVTVQKTIGGVNIDDESKWQTITLSWGGDTTATAYINMLEDWYSPFWYNIPTNNTNYYEHAILDASRIVRLGLIFDDGESGTLHSKKTIFIKDLQIGADPNASLYNTNGSLTVNQASLLFPSNSLQSSNIAIKSDTTWSINNQLDWITIDKKLGKGNDSITLIALENFGEAREGDIIIETSFGLSRTIHIIQDTKSPTIQILEDTIFYESYGGDKNQILIETNSIWTASSETNWISCINSNGVGNSNLKVQVSNNNSALERTGKIKISISGLPDTYVVISQKGVDANFANASIWQVDNRTRNVSSLNGLNPSRGYDLIDVNSYANVYNSQWKQDVFQVDFTNLTSPNQWCDFFIPTMFWEGLTENKFIKDTNGNVLEHDIASGFSIDFSNPENREVSFKIQANKTMNIRADLMDINGKISNGLSPRIDIKETSNGVDLQDDTKWKLVTLSWGNNAAADAAVSSMIDTYTMWWWGREHNNSSFQNSYFLDSAHIIGVRLTIDDGPQGNLNDKKTIYFKDIQFGAAPNTSQFYKAGILNVSKSELSFEASTNLQTSLHIQSDTTWTISNDYDWITINNVQGKGNDSIQLQLTQNNGDAREAYIIVSSSIGVARKIHIIQGTSNPELSISTKSISVKYITSEPSTFFVKANTPWKIVSNQDWVTCTPNSGVGNSQIFVVIQGNNTKEYRYAKLIIEAQGLEPVTVDIVQSPLPFNGTDVWIVEDATINVQTLTGLTPQNGFDKSNIGLGYADTYSYEWLQDVLKINFKNTLTPSNWNDFSFNFMQWEGLSENKFVKDGNGNVQQHDVALGYSVDFSNPQNRIVTFKVQADKEFHLRADLKDIEGKVSSGNSPMTNISATQGGVDVKDESKWQTITISWGGDSSATAQVNTLEDWYLSSWWGINNTQDFTKHYQLNSSKIIGLLLTIDHWDLGQLNDEKTIYIKDLQIGASDSLLQYNGDQFIVKTIQVTAGNLSNSLSNTSEKQTTRLILQGTIDIRDLIYIRDSLPFITNLDLSQVSIVAYEGDLDSALQKVYTLYPANTIPKGAFKNKSSLRSIVLPSNLVTVEDDAFSGCSNLYAIEFTNKEAISVEVSPTAFDGVNKYICRLIIPLGAEEVYASNKMMDDFSIIQKEGATVTQIPTIESASVHLFPNPTIQSFQIQGIEGSAKIVISDMFGRIAETKTITENESISVSNLASGLYNVQVISEQGIQQLQLIKK